MAHYILQTPVSEEAIRKLRINDTVTLQNTLFGIRDATQIHMFDHDRKTRFDLNGHAVIHTAPNVRKVPVSKEFPAGYEPICIGTTTSDRMERFHTRDCANPNSLWGSSARSFGRPDGNGRNSRDSGLGRIAQRPGRICG